MKTMDKSTILGGLLVFPWMWGILQLVVVGNPAYAIYLVVFCMVLNHLKTDASDGDFASSDGSASDGKDIAAAPEAGNLMSGDYSKPDEISLVVDAPAADVLAGGDTLSLLLEPKSRLPVQDAVLPVPSTSYVKTGITTCCIRPMRRRPRKLKNVDIRRLWPTYNLLRMDPHLLSPWVEDQIVPGHAFFVEAKYFYVRSFQNWMELKLRRTWDLTPGLSVIEEEVANDGLSFAVVEKPVPGATNSVSPVEGLSARGTRLKHRGAKLLRLFKKLCVCCGSG